MANRRPQGGGGGGRRDFRNDRNKNFGRNNVSPWQTGPGPGINNLFPLAGGSKEATLALASNIISSLLQPRPNPVPSLLDMPIRRDFGPNLGRYDRNPGQNRMGNQGNFRRSGNFNRSGDRGHNRKPFKANDGPRQQNKNSPRRDADPKSKAAKESTATSDSTKEEKEDSAGTEKNDSTNESKDNDPPKTRYDDIKTEFLKCHICNKSMWDGRSFENHLSGRAHSIMMQKTVESYALAADTMRQEFKIRDMKRTRKTGQPMARDFYCAMCDMYARDGAAHRTTMGHRKLKKYLHPSCTGCHKEMPTRIELDEHRLTPEHLLQMQEKSEINNKPKPEEQHMHSCHWSAGECASGTSPIRSPHPATAQHTKQHMHSCHWSAGECASGTSPIRSPHPATAQHTILVISTTAMEQIYLRDDRQRRIKRLEELRKLKEERSAADTDNTADSAAPATKDAQPTEEKEETTKEGENAEGDKVKKTEESEKTCELDSESTVTDYKQGDDLSKFTKEMLPAYSVERAVGQSFIEEFKCYSCKLCKKLLDTEETAKIHLRTWRHHQLFTKMLYDMGGFSDSNKRKLDVKEEVQSPQKRAKTDSEEEQNGHDTDADNKDKDGDVEMGEGWTQGEDLEDWEQSVDEILEDEQYNPEEPNEDTDDPVNEDILNEDVTKEPVEKEPEPAAEAEQEKTVEVPVEEEEVPVKEKTPPPVAQTRTRGTPRGRARRGRRF